jgi:hypothetical protein
MSHKRWSYLIAALSLIAAVAACNTPGGPASTVTMPPIDIPTVLPGILSPTPAVATQAGATALIPSLTPSGSKPTSAPPQPTRAQATSAPVAPAGPAAKRVSFATGATQAEVTGSLAAGGIDRYVLGVGSGQDIEVGSEGPSDLTLVITGANGSVLVSGGSLVRTSVPATGDYVVQVKAGGSALNYKVLIVIPERASFGKNATELTLQGQAPANSAHHYALNLQAGQLIDIQFSNAGGFHSALYGLDGKYLQGADGTGVGFRGRVPTPQDYILVVAAGAQAVSYTIHVIVPQRISFPAGATWIDAQGTLPANGRFQYVLNLAAGQAMQIQSNTATAGYTLAVTGPDGAAVPGASTTSPFFRGKVPTGGDTIVTLTNGGAATSYDLAISVPIRISFGSGANSATKTGTLTAHERVDYVIAAGAGQTLEVIFTPANTAKMTIYGNDGTVQWSGMGEGTHWSGSLPGTQDYFITFQAGSSAVGAYTLKVTIK